MKLFSLYCFSLLGFWSLALLSANDVAPIAPKSILHLGLVPSELITSQGLVYSDQERDCTRVIGINHISRGGWQWAAWVADGDCDLGYFVLISSDDRGETWSRLLLSGPLVEKAALYPSTVSAAPHPSPIGPSRRSKT